MTANEFFKNVITTIKKIPKGQVATYGQVAKLSGKEHGARGVAWILHSSSRKHKLPWHRVINAQGAISFPKGATHHSLQKRRLIKEGVEFTESGKIRLADYQWQK